MEEKKKIDQICKNCKLFDPKEGVCAVVVIHKGEHLELKTNSEDECHWIKNGIVENIQQLRAWSDGKQGYVEYTI